MFVPCTALNCRHPTTALFARVSDQKRRYMEEEEAQAGSATEFQAYVRPVYTVMPFKYLGRLLTAT